MNKPAAVALEAELAPLKAQLNELYATAPPPVWEVVPTAPFLSLVSTGLSPAEQAMESLIKARMQKLRNNRGFA